MRVLSFVVAGLLLTASAAQAAPLSLSNLSGDWNEPSVDADGATAATVNVVNLGGSLVDLIQWGEGSNNSGLQSGYTFDPRDGIIDPLLDTPFLLGTFTHINNTIRAATSNFTGVDYDFSFDTNGVPAQFENVLSFTHMETLNSGPCPEGDVPCPDIVTVTILELTSMLIQVGSEIYLFELLGFSQDGTGITNEFISPEGETNSSGLWAKVTFRGDDPDVPEVPEPASLGLLGAGLALVAHQVRRRRAARRNG